MVKCSQLRYSILRLLAASIMNVHMSLLLDP